MMKGWLADWTRAHPFSSTRTKACGFVTTIRSRPNLIQPIFSQALSVRLTVYKVVPE